MADLILRSKDPREIERFVISQSGFYAQTVDENNARLDGLPKTVLTVLAEIKIIQAALISRFGEGGGEV